MAAGGGEVNQSIFINPCVQTTLTTANDDVASAANTQAAGVTFGAEDERCQGCYTQPISILYIALVGTLKTTIQQPNRLSPEMMASPSTLVSQQGQAPASPVYSCTQGDPT